MTAMMSVVGAGRPFTVHDLEAMPDDGHRYELLDGVLLVSPAPGMSHQTMVLELAVLLRGACPQEQRVIVAPFAVRPSATIELQPDVLVARAEDLTETHLPAAPLLAVEVLSPTTALFDLNTKKAAYERLGVPSYWVLDPQEPELIVFELDDAGSHRQAGQVRGGAAFDATTPFPVRIVPTQLVAGPS